LYCNKKEITEYQKHKSRKFYFFNGISLKCFIFLFNMPEHSLHENSEYNIITIPSSTRTTSTTALYGISTWCVHMQLAPQSAGLLSPLQNCSGGMSLSCESGGAGGNVNEISSTREITWSPVGATADTQELYSESHISHIKW